MSERRFLTTTDKEEFDSQFSQLSEENAKQLTTKPLVYIDGVIPTTKDDVLAELTYKHGNESWHAYIKIKCQGNSSLAYPKKNFTVKLYSDEARETKLKKKMFGWSVANHKFVLKANWIDHLHARNLVTANIWSEIIASRDDYETLPEELRNSPNNGAVDGYPIIVYTNGDYQGIYTWNIGKDDWMWGMDEDNPNHVLLNTNYNTSYIFEPVASNFRALWSGTDGDKWEVEIGTNSDAVKNALNDLITCVKDTTDEEFIAQIDTYLDVQSAIDYYLLSCADCGVDNLGNNMLLATYDLKKWRLGKYDLDTTWGLNWGGSSYNPPTLSCPGEYGEMFSLLFERIEKCFRTRFVNRGKELRKSALSAANITAHFERMASVIGAEAYADDLVPYSGIPSSGTNNIRQIRAFVKERLAYYDNWLDAIANVENYVMLYPLRDGTFHDDYLWRKMAISNGNHVKFDAMAQSIFANFYTGALRYDKSVLLNNPKLFSLKAGDVVRWEIKNPSMTELYSANGSMSLVMYGSTASIDALKAGDIPIGTMGNEYSKEITVTSDVDVHSIGCWLGGNTQDTWSTFEFDLYLYVNGVRYV